MKKIILSGIIFISISMCYGQVFNTAKTLKKGTVALGINPVFMGSDFGIYLHGGIGLKQGLDLGGKVGLGLGGNYFGADLEWALTGNKPYVSFSAGGHIQGDFGIDGTLNITFPLAKNVYLFSGADMDINFGNTIGFPLWIPIGLEVGIRKQMNIILEGDIGVLDNAGSMFGGGLNLYF